MKLKKITIAVSVCIMMLAIPYAAQAGAHAAVAAQPESGTLTIQTETYEAPGLTAVVDLYKKANPKVNVTFLNLTSTTARSENILQLSSSAAPDIGFVELGSDVYSPLVSHNELESLAPVWKADNLYNEYPAGSIAYMNSGTSSTPYGMFLFAGLGSMLFYNKTLFAKAGVQPPAGRLFKNMAEFNTLVDKLKAKGITPLELGCNSTVALGHLVDDLLPTSATPSQFLAYTGDWHKGSKSPVQFTDSPFVNVLQTIENWATEGTLEPGCLSVNDTENYGNFANGEAAMYEGSTYNVPEIIAAATKPAFPVGWFMMPPITAGVKTPFWNYSGSMFVVPTHAPDVALAMNFLQFLGKPSNLSLYAADNLSLPVIRDAVREHEPSQIFYQVVDLEKTVGSDVPWDAAVPATLGQKTEVPLLEEMVAGTLSVRATAKDFQQAFVALQTGKVVPTGM